MLLGIHPQTLKNQISCPQNLEFSKALFFQTRHSINNNIFYRFLCFRTENLSQRIRIFLCVKCPNKTPKLRAFCILRLAQIIDVRNTAAVLIQHRNTLCPLLQSCTKTLP